MPRPYSADKLDADAFCKEAGMTDQGKVTS